jgi:hypothetical protein
LNVTAAVNAFQYVIQTCAKYAMPGVVWIFVLILIHALNVTAAVNAFQYVIQTCAKYVIMAYVWTNVFNTHVKNVMAKVIVSATK